MRYIIALDQGTTSSRAIIFDHEQNIVAKSQKEFMQFYPLIRPRIHRLTSSLFHPNSLFSI